MNISVEDFGNSYVPDINPCDPFLSPEDEIKLGSLPFYDVDNDFSHCSLSDRIDQKCEDWGL